MVPAPLETLFEYRARSIEQDETNVNWRNLWVEFLPGTPLYAEQPRMPLIPASYQPSSNWCRVASQG